jgi:quercetin dioxygenase-like cupin family protein
MRRIFGTTDGEERHAHDGCPRTVRLLIEPATAGARHLAMGTEAVDPGSRIPVHVHDDAEEILFLYAGRGRARVGDEEIEVGPETAIFVPPGAPHGFANTTAEPAHLTWTFSPPGAQDKFRDEAVWKHGRREAR